MTREEAIHILDNLKPTNAKSSFDAYVVGKAITMAIKALEQEPTTKNDLGVDAVSRQAALDACHNFAIGILDDYYEKCLKQWIIDLPSVTPQESRWIPVSEKLPNDRNWYLGIFKEPDTGWINPLPFICDYVGRETKATTKGYWILRGFTDWDDYHIDYYFNLECVAWMPLPLPWKGE